MAMAEGNSCSQKGIISTIPMPQQHLYKRKLPAFPQLPLFLLAINLCSIYVPTTIADRAKAGAAAPAIVSYQTGNSRGIVALPAAAVGQSSASNRPTASNAASANVANSAVGVNGGTQNAAENGITSSSSSSSSPTSSSSASTSSSSAPSEPASTIVATTPAIPVAENTTGLNCDGPRRPCNLGGRNDFNPALSAGRETQGIKIRLNPSSFQYLSHELVGVLNYQIKRASLPEGISQCLPQVQGCLRVRNIFISNYRCTRDVSLNPASPNLLMLDINNLDISVDGDLGGQITIMVPMALYGRVHLDANRVHVRVGVVLFNNGTSPALRMASCSAQVGHVQMNIQNGGLLGDIARQQLQVHPSAKINSNCPATNWTPALPACSRPIEPASQLKNSRSGSREISTKRAASNGREFPVFVKIDGRGDEDTAAGTEEETTTSVIAKSMKKRREIANAKNMPQKSIRPNVMARNPGQDQHLARKPGISMKKHRREIESATHLATNGRGHNLLKDNEVRIGRRQSAAADGPKSGGVEKKPKADDEEEWITAEASDGDGSTTATTTTAAGGDNTDAEAAAADADASASGTDGSGSSADGAGGGDSIGPALQSIFAESLTKMDSIQLNLHLANTAATPNSYTVGIRGGFSVCAWDCTPFGAFPMEAPPCAGANCKMADVLVSDYTVNSLLYHLHRVGFFIFTIGYDTPTLGKLMVLNCEDSAAGGGDGSGDSDSGSGGVFFLEDHGVELENGTMTKERAKAKKMAKRRRGMKKTAKRTRRQESGDTTTTSAPDADAEEGTCSEGGGMSVDSVIELGFCIGSLLPAAKSENEEKGEHEKVDLTIHTERAPVAFIHENGTITLEFIALMDFRRHSTGTLITTFHINSVLNANVEVEDDNTVKAKLEVLKLEVRDIGGKSGIEQETLDTFISLIGEKVLEAVNCMIAAGCKIEVPEGGIAGLPLDLSNLKIGFVEHALHLQADFKLSEDSDILGGSEPCNTTMRTMRQRSLKKKV